MNILIFFNSRGIRHHFYLPSCLHLYQASTAIRLLEFCLFLSKLLFPTAFVSLSGFVYNLYKSHGNEFLVKSRFLILFPLKSYGFLFTFHVRIILLHFFWIYMILTLIYKCLLLVQTI